MSVAARLIFLTTSNIGCRLCRQEKMDGLLAAIRNLQGDVLGIVVDPADSRNREVYFHVLGGAEEIDNYMASGGVTLR